MPFPIRRAPRVAASMPLALLVAALLAGCAGTPAAIADIRYDFGPQRLPANGGALPPLKVLDVTAAPPLDADRIVYRLGYDNAQRTSAYAHSHWTMTPAQLLTQRLRGALAARGAVLTGADTIHAPLLDVRLEAFEQVFDAPSHSHAEIIARATLQRSALTVSQYTFSARVPAGSPDAAGAAASLAAASDDLVAQIAAWLAVQLSGLAR